MGLLLAVVLALLVCGNVRGLDFVSGDDVELLSSQTAADKPTLLAVAGTSTVTRKPNQCVVTLRVHSEGAQPSDTRAKHVQRLVPVRAAIHAFFRQHRDNPNDLVEHESLSITPRYEWSNNENHLVGYEATSVFTVKIDELSESGALVDAAVAHGASLDGVAMTLKDAETAAAADEARTLAVKDALRAASRVAAAAGLRVVGLSSIRDASSMSPAGGGFAPRAMMMERAVTLDAAGGGAGRPYSNAAGVLTFHSSVYVEALAEPSRIHVERKTKQPQPH